ncbi:D-alanyl-lipoteichoic acid biosynthesis protein DltD [Bacillus sp. AFS017336]|uniref:D-alanyl-lipoteichoic acid biosynthesis protein DltD n=1 Tax=Bacillus sp. AFS017336 TaxID=2033489 RepID=UPI000BEFB1A3|nr:D-alanyl-lipoteichoic acid biosynthesis protein DltD [Bacillus sp. AFS017336]PEL12058.1 D-alanyl-lipoteichoic acid biosynthesis protein DltD [Bacillus sp. AFS017336]
MKKVQFFGMITAIFIFLLALYLPNSFYELFITKERLNNTAASLNPKTFQGTLLQDKMLTDPKFLPIFGSSELARRDTFHPSRFFMGEKNEFTPYLIGRGGSQSLVHFLDLASLGDGIKNKKIVFVLSPQWFIRRGINNTHFSPNYSALQTYSFVLNNTINRSVKKQAAKRLLTLSIIKKDSLLVTQLKALTSTNKKIKFKAFVEKPLAYTYFKILEKKDLFETVIMDPDKNFHLTKSKYEDLPWNKVAKAADKIGRSQSSSNHFGINNKYYKKYIQNRLVTFKNSKRNKSYSVSPEYDDLQMVLAVLKQEHTKALFISVPVNGPWYDYAGFPKKVREVYYKKVKKQIGDAGFHVADFSSHDYDKFFLKDTIHLGWKGWVYVDRSLNKFYSVNHTPSTASLNHNRY